MVRRSKAGRGFDAALSQRSATKRDAQALFSALEGVSEQRNKGLNKRHIRQSFYDDKRMITGMADEKDTPDTQSGTPLGADGGPQIQFNTDGAAAPGQAPGSTDANAQDSKPQAGMLAQYIKDISFENPNAPQIFQKLQTAQPNIKIGINVAGRQVSQDTFEVELKLEANSTADDEPVYMVELVYAGLFQLRNLPDDAMQPFLLIEAPRLLFPFARRIISDAVRDGGYPPLTLEPIDFAALYQHRMAQANQGAQTGGVQTAN